MTLLRATGLPPAGAMVHAFSGSGETAAELQRLGLHLSFGPRRGLRALAATAADRLLFETDAPWGGDGSEPADLPGVAAAAARERSAGPELAAQAGRNARQLFRRLMP